MIKFNNFKNQMMNEIIKQIEVLLIKMLRIVKDKNNKFKIKKERLVKKV
jgi:hypothetical protein